MTSKYCDTCNHGKQYHIKNKYDCTVKDCKCQMFNRGVKRDVKGFEVK